MFQTTISDIINAQVDMETGKLDYQAVIDAVDLLGFDGIVQLSAIEGKDIQSVIDQVNTTAWSHYEMKTKPVKDQVAHVERNVVLRIIDRQWVDHIDTMSHLREGIHLRSYAQSNPLQQYIEEGFHLFEQMIKNIAQEVVQWSMRVEVKER